ncbi:MAG: HAMP domain-containing histidine kinase [Flavobacteriales bacterium]|nr:HAMP domain-containing histidine kinase [Flavobacteriales bacterium]
MFSVIGSEFSVEIGLNHSYIKDDLKVVAIVTDITERVLSQQKLKDLNIELEYKVKLRTVELEKSQKLYNLIARNFPRGVINVFDRDLNFVFIEGQELDRLGFTSQNLIGENYKKRFKGDLAELVKEKFNAVFNGEGLSFEFENKSNFYVANAVPLRSSDGIVEQILVIEKNITDSKLVEQELANNLEKERDLNELKSRFVSMASHEFRTPLSTILSSAILAGKYEEKEQQDKREKHLNRIKSSVKNLTSILNDFLSIDKLEEGKIEITESEFLLNELFQEAHEEMEFFLKNKQFITYKSNSSDNQMVITDRNVIKNILINLLSNASKYSAEGEEIVLDLNVVGKGIRVDVVDKGIGIPEKEQDKLFSNRFFRAGNVTNIEGTGLGLTIVKKYLSLVEGDISFKSKENVGTTFSIIIPNILL